MVASVVPVIAPVTSIPAPTLTLPIKVALPFSLVLKESIFILLPPSLPAITISPSLISFTRLIVSPVPP